MRTLKEIEGKGRRGPKGWQSIASTFEPEMKFYERLEPIFD